MKLDRSELSVFILIENFGAEIGHFISVPAKKSSSGTKKLAGQGAHRIFENCPCIHGQEFQIVKTNS